MEKYAAEHILGLTGEYDAHALKAAFHEHAAKHHPDAAEAHGMDRAAATAKMQEINEANDCLRELLEMWGPTLTCEREPAPADDPQHRGMSWAPPPPTSSAAFNPFEGYRAGAADRRARTHMNTSQYYWNDPRYQPPAGAARDAGTDAQGRQRFNNGEYESFGKRPQPTPEDTPERPFPKWYLPIWRFFATFPYRFVLLLAVCLLVNLTDPLGVSAKLGFISFEDMLILLALVNLVIPFLTAPIRAGLLWLVDRCRDLAWNLRGAPR